MFQLLLEKYHLKGPTKALRQHFGVPVPKVCKGRDKEDANMSQGIKRLPRAHDPGRHSAVVSTGPNHHSCLRIFPPSGSQTSVHNTFEYHDQRSQQMNVGGDPMFFVK